MPKLTFNAHELTDANVDFVAMVKRGANRIPFRITKSEDADMIDLSKLARTVFLKADPKPAVAAVIFDGAAPAAYAPVGFAKSEADGLTTFAKADVKDGGTLLVKTLSGAALAVTLIEDTLRKAEFAPYADANGSVMSVALATETFKKSVDQLFGSDAGLTSAEQQQAFAEASASFNKYLQAALVMPVEVAKMEAELVKAAGGDSPGKKKPSTTGGGDDDEANSGDEGPGSTTGPQSGAGDGPNDDDEDDQKPVKKDGDRSPGAAVVEEEDDSNRAASVDDKKDSVTEDPKRKPDAQIPGGVKKLDPTKGKPKNPGGMEGEGDLPADADIDDTSDKARAVASATADDAKVSQNLKGPAQKSDDAAPVMAALAEMSKTFSGSIAAITKSITDLNDRVEAVAVQARKTDAALNGTVFAEAGEDRRAPARKSEVVDAAPPLLDTAYSRRTE